MLIGSHNVTDLGKELAFEWPTNPLITLIFETSRIPQIAEQEFIATIIKDLPTHIEGAADFLLSKLKSTDPTEIDISGPRANFRLGGSWEIHFQNAMLLESDGLGVLVSYSGEYPERIEILNLESASWFDFDTGEWAQA